MDTFDELALYETNRSAWLEYAAPRMASRIASSTDEQIRVDWNRAPRDYQTAVWQHLDDTQRARIRKVRNAA